MVSFLLSAQDRNSKQHVKSIKADGYTKKQLSYIETLYKKHIKDGKPKSEFKILEIDVPLDGEKTSIEKPHFEKRSLDTIKMPDNNCLSWLMIGSTKSGKSYAINHIYENYFKKHITILMTLSAHHEIYKEFKRKAVIADGFHSQLIEEPMKINKMTKNHYSFCCITDDLALDGKNSPAMIKLLTIGRNSGMSFIGGIQKATLMNATGRTNVNVICFFKQNTDSEIESSIKCFLRSYFPKGMRMIEMISMYRKLTEDHHFLCYDSLAGEVFHCRI